MKTSGSLREVLKNPRIRGSLISKSLKNQKLEVTVKKRDNYPHTV
jgi:hypothetical protein